MESIALEERVEKEDKRWIPKNLFMGRDAMPGYGIFPSLWRATKECLFFKKEGVKGIIREGLRCTELGIVCAYNLGLLELGKLAYNSIAN